MCVYLYVRMKIRIFKFFFLLSTLHLKSLKEKLITSTIFSVERIEWCIGLLVRLADLHE